MNQYNTDLLKLVLHHTMSLYSTYETIEKQLHGADRTFMHNLKRRIEQNIENYCEYFREEITRETETEYHEHG